MLYYEWPEVEFQGNLVISYLDSEGVSRTFSNVREINELYEQDWVAGVPTITYSRDHVATVDKTQSVRLKIDMAGVEPNKVRRLAVFASFGY